MHSVKNADRFIPDGKLYCSIFPFFPKRLCFSFAHGGAGKWGKTDLMRFSYMSCFCLCSCNLDLEDMGDCNQHGVVINLSCVWVGVHVRTYSCKKKRTPQPKITLLLLVDDAQIPLALHLYQYLLLLAVEIYFIFCLYSIKLTIYFPWPRVSCTQINCFLRMHFLTK